MVQSNIESDVKKEAVLCSEAVSRYLFGGDEQKC